MNYLERLHGEAEGDETVAQLVSRKGDEIWSVTPSDSVAACIALMCEQDIGVVLVLDDAEGGRLVGILSERDCLRRVVARGLDPASTEVREVMTKDVVAAWPLQQIEECLETLNDHRIRHIPVVEKGRVTGLVSLRDIAAAELERRKALLEVIDEVVHG